MGLIKSAEQILAGKPRPVDFPARKPGPGRPPLYVGCTAGKCPKAHHGQGLCAEHLRRRNRWGDELHEYVPAGPHRCGCPIHRPLWDPNWRERKGGDPHQQDAA